MFDIFRILSFVSSTFRFVQFMLSKLWNFPFCHWTLCWPNIRKRNLLEQTDILIHKQETLQATWNTISLDCLPTIILLPSAKSFIREWFVMSTDNIQIFPKSRVAREGRWSFFFFACKCLSENRQETERYKVAYYCAHNSASKADEMGKVSQNFKKRVSEGERECRKTFLTLRNIFSALNTGKKASCKIV